MDSAIKRRRSRELRVGNVPVGGGSPVSVQSMTNTVTSDVAATIAQIKALVAAGCEIVRVAVPDAASARAIAMIRREVTAPIVADIHFDWRLAIAALESGADALRINPGNIGERARVRELVKAASERRVPIRIGVNSGSLEKKILLKHGHPTARALVESAAGHIRILEDMDFRDIKVSIKASSVPVTIEAYREMAAMVDYPLHIGVTEAGTPFSGAVKSAVGLGVLLAEGIGDTLRVSLSGDPVVEARVGWQILKALELRRRGANVISCPTCGRVKLDCARIAAEVEDRLAHLTDSVNVAVMGCVVNGPGEAMEADVGVAGGDGEGLIYVRGKAVRKVSEGAIVDAVVDETLRFVDARRASEGLGRS